MITKNKLQAFLDQGLSIIPLKDKIPNLKSWQKYTKELYKLGDDVSEFKSVGLVMGDMTHLSTIDIDEKYFIPKEDGESLYSKLKANIIAYSPGTWEKLTIQTTKNGGYHLIFKIKEDKQKGSVKLAEREATEEEKKEGQTKLVLIETRSANSYIVCYPSDGYKVTQGKLLDVQYISKEERDLIYACSRMLSEVMPPVFKSNTKIEWQSEGEKPWDAYCNDPHHWKTVMEKNGWTLKPQKGSKIPVCRPGSKTPSGNFDTSYNLLRVFSTSQDTFSPDTSYNPFMIFCNLETGGDIKAGAKQLRDLNYGHTPEPKFKQKDKPVEFDNSHEYLYDESEDENIFLFSEGKLPLGFDTGYLELDDYFRIKPGKFNCLAGHMNLGKSYVAWNIYFAFCIRHNEKMIFLSRENKAWSIKQDLIQFLFGKNITRLNRQQIKEGLKIVKKHITFIETSEFPSYHWVLEKAEEINRKEKHFGLLIDPYSSLTYDFSKTDRKLSTYEYHYDAATRIKHWADVNDCHICLVLHAVTEAQRKVHTEADLKGLIKPIIAADVEFGSLWSNRCDDFLVVHRYANHPEWKNQTHIHTVKIKEEWSGGQRTMQNQPVILSLWNGGNDFFGFWDKNGSNPFFNYAKKHILGEETKQNIKTTEDEEVEDTYEQDFYSNKTLSAAKPDLPVLDEEDLEEDDSDEPPF
jgi:hypothetical protein